jgi:AbiV family abortive infection protein
MGKKYPRRLNEGQIKEGCKRCKENVRGMLNGASILLKHQDSQQYALGLYIYAVEEYGKSISLREVVDGSRVTYEIPEWIFEDHATKLIKGFENLPKECRMIARGIRVSSNFSKENKVIKIDADRQVTIGAFATGWFLDVSPYDYKQNIILKETCFYIDWDRRNGTWNYDIVTDVDRLKKNIDYFKKALNQFSCF